MTRLDARMLRRNMADDPGQRALDALAVLAEVVAVYAQLGWPIGDATYLPSPRAHSRFRHDDFVRAFKWAFGCYPFGVEARVEQRRAMIGA